VSIGLQCDLMEKSGEEPVPAVPLASINPFISLTILEIALEDVQLGFRRLVEELKKRSLKSRQGRRSFAALGIDDSFYDSAELQWMVDGIYDVEAAIVRCDQRPQWMKVDSLYIDTEFKLVVAFRRNNLVAVYTDLPSLRESLQAWLNKSPRPPFRRITEGVMHAAFIRGDTKGLWLRGTHARRTTKADTKNLSGKRLEDALLPHEDSSFAMGSARVMLPSDLGLAALSGVVGTTPRKSQVWARATDDASDFFAQVNDALVLVEDVLSAGLSVDQPFPLLAQREEELTNVAGAFDYSLLDPDSIASSTNTSTEILDAAALLSRATIELEGSSTSSSFVLHVGLDGTIGGSLSGRIAEDHGAVSFHFGFKGEPTNGPPVRQILDALAAHGDDLLTIYYESGHTVVEKSLWKRELRILPFPNWQFHDLTGVDIDREKPPVRGDQAIHDAIGQAGDSSLFGWVVKHFAAGWLVCDDGSGEIADFIHISTDAAATLSLIHVKGAKSTKLSRQVAVGPYEVVASQAAKNIRYLSPEYLRKRLADHTLKRPACWTNGRRVPSRDEFLEMLDCRHSADPICVVIIQPHVSELIHADVRNDRERGLGHSRNVLRMSLLEALLNTARSSIVGSGADLYVIGGKL
jgi:hypothetical protein